MGRVKEYGMSTPGGITHVEDQYFAWLCDKVLVNRPKNSYFQLVSEMHRHAFIWSVLNDDNREADGVSLRTMFLEETNYYEWPEFLSKHCSLLEMLIGLALRCEEQMRDQKDEMSARECFWKFLENADLLRFDDDAFAEPNTVFSVRMVLDRILSRTYMRNGNGGFFPLRHPKKDQRKVELWYQMMAWLLENYYSDD